MSKTISTVKVLTRQTLNRAGLTPIITWMRSFMPAKNHQQGAGSADWAEIMAVVDWAEIMAVVDWAEIMAVVDWAERTNPDPLASPGRAHRAAAARPV